VIPTALKQDEYMNALMLVALALGAVVIAVGTVWFLLRPASGEPDLGSISRNWMTEHRNDHD
jgi:hypothetical protein